MAQLDNDLISVIIEASPVPLVITRVVDGRILYANKHLGRLLDLEAEQLVGQVSPDFYYDPQDRVMLLESLEREGRVDSLEVRLKRIELVRQFGELPPVICYPSQLNQVFLHLLTNAMQAIDEQGRICIRTGLVEGHVWISIEDSGRGMSPEQLERVFDPGFTTKGGRIGAGLGLSICYQIIQDHRGEIQAESVPGEGTTFTMVLPVDLSKEPASEEGGRSEAEHSTHD